MTSTATKESDPSMGGGFGDFGGFGGFDFSDILNSFFGGTQTGSARRNARSAAKIYISTVNII